VAYVFQDRLDYLGRRRKQIDVIEGSYTRTGWETILRDTDGNPILDSNGDQIPLHTPGPLTGILFSMNRTQTEEYIPGVAITRLDRQEFVFDTVDIITLGEPQTNDLITLVDGRKFRVSPPPDEKSCFNYTTPSRARIRVYTEQVGR
jgi:hypothetical protein